MERGEHERARLLRRWWRHRSATSPNPSLSESVLGFFVRSLNLLRCSHPGPVIVVTAISGFLALLAGRGIGTFWVVGAVLTGQLFVGWSNDYLDRDHDLHAARTDKPVVTGQVKAATVASAAALALLFCVPLSLASSLGAALVHLVAISLATLYNLRLKATVLSVLPYIGAFALLPAFITLGLPTHDPPPYWAILVGALIGAGAHFTQTLPDIEVDLREGVSGLPHRIGPRGSAIVASLLLGAAAIVVALGPGMPSAIDLAGLFTTLILVVMVLIAVWKGHPRAAFRLTLVIATVVVITFLLSGRRLT